MNDERRKYRFRVWDKVESKIYPVISMARGGIVIQDKEGIRTSTRDQVELMQYSGLKDSNGQEIYESDLLIGQNDDNIYQVTFTSGAFRIKLFNGEKDELGEVLSEDLIGARKLSVTGNIFELVKGQH
jgi:hypothetical protein